MQATTGSAGATFGRTLTQEDRDNLVVGSPKRSESPDRGSLTPSSLRRIHPLRPDSRPPPEGTSGFVSSSRRFSPTQDVSSTGMALEQGDVQGSTPSTSQLAMQESFSHPSLGRQERPAYYLHPQERHPPPQHGPQMRTPLLAGMSRRPPNEMRMRELFQIFMREKHQDPGPGSHEVWSPVMKGERVDHRRPHVHGVDGPVYLHPGDKSMRVLEMERTIYKRESGPSPTAYDAQRSAFASTKRRVDMTSVASYKPPETVKVVSKSKSILDGRNWRDPSLPYVPPAALRPPSAVTGREAVLSEPRNTAAVVSMPGMEEWAAREAEAARAPVVVEESVQSNAEEGEGGIEDSEAADRHAVEELMELSRSEAVSPPPAGEGSGDDGSDGGGGGSGGGGGGGGQLPVLRLEQVHKVESGQSLSPVQWDSSSNSGFSYQFDPLARLSVKQRPLPEVPLVKPPPAVMRSSNTREAPSDWAWNSLKPTSKAGTFSGKDGGAYSPSQRLVRRAALKQRVEVVHSLQQAEMKRRADEVSSWTVPSWVDEYMSGLRAGQDIPITSKDGLMLASSSGDGLTREDASLNQTNAEKVSKGEIASPAPHNALPSLPIPADPEIAPRVEDIVRHERAAQMADDALQVKEKRLQWEVRSQTMKSTFGTTPAAHLRTGLPAMFSMADPLRHQPLPKKRIMTEALY